MKFDEKPKELLLGLVAQDFWNLKMCYTINV
jgi:hypothetical protein